MRMSGENTETLHLTQLQRESGGNYACGAQNSEGETRSTTLTLNVQCKLNSFHKIIISSFIITVLCQKKNFLLLNCHDNLTICI